MRIERTHMAVAEASAVKVGRVVQVMAAKGEQIVDGAGGET